MPDYVETRGAKPIFEDNKRLAQQLIDISFGNIILTSYMRHRMQDEGYIRIVPNESNGTRGRPSSTFMLTPKAKRVIALSKAWSVNRKKAA